jgi:DMSO/TMAO reductase YedYZ molybdopterin-dependent catalytic subunit
MITRRRVIAGSAGALVLWTTAASADQAVVNGSAVSEDSLVTLPGKKPLIRRSFRPPNLETPLADLRRPFTANDAFFVRYHLASIPEVDGRTWKLRIGGASAQRALELSLDDLRHGFEHVSVAAINQCSGNRRGLFAPRAPGIQWGYGAMGNAVWSGVRLRDVLQKAGVGADALEVVFDGADRPLLSGTPDFVKSLPVHVALDENTLIALTMNGGPLPHWNGAPARIVVPGWTATYWVKHLSEIRIEPKAFDGFWMKTAYRVPRGAFPGARFESQDAPENTPITEILVNSLVTSHENGQTIERGKPAELAGWAWDGGTGIRTVDVSLDQGQSWRPAKLGTELGRFAWRGFSLALDPKSTGPLQISVRATSQAGAHQPDALTPNPSGYHHNIVQTLALEVR